MTQGLDVDVATTQRRTDSTISQGTSAELNLFTGPHETFHQEETTKMIRWTKGDSSQETTLSVRLRGSPSSASLSPSPPKSPASVPLSSKMEEVFVSRPTLPMTVAHSSRPASTTSPQVPRPVLTTAVEVSLPASTTQPAPCRRVKLKYLNCLVSASHVFCSSGSSPHCIVAQSSSYQRDATMVCAAPGSPNIVEGEQEYFRIKCERKAVILAREFLS